jgi:hypothetical protein
VAVSATVAFVFPTPPSTYVEQPIERSALTVHEGSPDARCELPGAFAGLKLPASGVYVPGSTANATEADTAISNVNKAVKVPSRLIFRFLLTSVCFDWLVMQGHPTEWLGAESADRLGHYAPPPSAPVQASGN